HTAPPPPHLPPPPLHDALPIWRLALDNFMAFAPDALAPLGGYPGDEDKAREVFPKLDQAKTREDFVAAASYLKNRPDCTGKIGADRKSTRLNSSHVAISYAVFC